MGKIPSIGPYLGDKGGMQGQTSKCMSLHVLTSQVSMSPFEKTKTVFGNKNQ